MQITDLDDPIEVRADFKGGSVRPRLFRRNGALYKIESVHAVWRDTEGQFRIYFYSVEVEGTVYQLRWRTQDNLWFIDHVIAEG